jgi:hypothetical protein
VARTLELLFRFQPVRRATEVRADRLQGKDFTLAVVLGIDDPNPELAGEFGVDLVGAKVVLEADFELAGRLGQNVGGT